MFVEGANDETLRKKIYKSAIRRRHATITSIKLNHLHIRVRSSYLATLQPQNPGLDSSTLENNMSLLGKGSVLVWPKPELKDKNRDNVRRKTDRKYCLRFETMM